MNIYKSILFSIIVCATSCIYSAENPELPSSLPVSDAEEETTILSPEGKELIEKIVKDTIARVTIEGNNAKVKCNESRCKTIITCETKHFPTLEKLDPHLSKVLTNHYVNRHARSIENAIKEDEEWLDEESDESESQP